MTTFFRLLKTEIDAKGEMLAAQINARNNGESASDVYVVAPIEFGVIPESPFAYWANELLLRLFKNLPLLERSGITAQYGASTKNDFRFLRLSWEIQPDKIGRDMRWIPHAKGGYYAHYFSDIHLLINWINGAQEIKEYITERYPYLKGETAWLLHPESFYFRAGVTWTRRTASDLSVRALPAEVVFGDKGPSAFVEEDEKERLLSLLGIMNSKVFSVLVALQLGTAMVGHSFEVGIIKQIPMPSAIPIVALGKLASHAQKSHDLTRDFDRASETSHAYCVPALVQHHQLTLQTTYLLVQEMNFQAQTRLTEIQNEIDEIVAELYGLKKVDFAEVVSDSEGEGAETGNEEDEDEEQETTAPITNLKSEIENLLSWCIGCVVGRWDIRFALDPTLLPKLQDPFDPLPRCSPGMLVGTDGLPATPDNIVSEEWLRARPNVITLPTEWNSASEQSGAEKENSLPSPIITPDQYPLKIDWDGILTDDPDHPDDIVRRVRDVLTLLWQERADDIEAEACDILGVESLREYFRQPKHFFDFHIKRYSKSRRKAPIYWLLQSSKKNYGLWLYYHRLTPDTLFKARVKYVEPKINLENIKLNDLRAQLTPMLGARERRDLEKAITKQQAFISELTDFSQELKRVADLYLAPDFDDGVIISIAPLHKLVPWKEAGKMWDELVSGKYEWSTMSQKMRAKGLVKSIDANHKAN